MNNPALHPELAVVFIDHTGAKSSKVLALLRNIELYNDSQDSIHEVAQQLGYTVATIPHYFQGFNLPDWNPTAALGLPVQDAFYEVYSEAKKLDSDTLEDEGELPEHFFGSALYFETPNNSYAEVMGVFYWYGAFNLQEAVPFGKSAQAANMITTESMEFNLTEIKGVWSFDFN